MSIALIVSALFQLTSCSHYLYYPTRHHRVNSEKISNELKLKHEVVNFQSEDGVRLHGWYFPSRKTDKPKATLVFFHGNAENISTHFGSLAWVVNYEYSYFIFDYRGYGYSDGKPSPKGTVLDGIAAVKWIEKREPGVPIVLFGQSLGGAIALSTAIELKENKRVQAVIADSTFESYQSVAANVLSKHTITWPFQWLAYLTLSDRHAPEDRLEEIAGKPILVMHGDVDSKVDFSLGEQLYESASPPKEFWRIRDGRHIDSFWRHKGKYKEKLISYLDELFPIASPSDDKHRRISKSHR